MNDKGASRYFLCFRPSEAPNGERKLVRRGSCDDRGSKSSRRSSCGERDWKASSGRSLWDGGDLKFSWRSYSERWTKSPPGKAEGNCSSKAVPDEDSVGKGYVEREPLEPKRKKTARAVFSRIVNALAFRNLSLHNKNRSKRSTEDSTSGADLSFRQSPDDQIRSSSFSSRRSSHERRSSRSYSFSGKRCSSTTCRPNKAEERCRPPRYELGQIESSPSFSSVSTSSSTSSVSCPSRSDSPEEQRKPLSRNNDCAAGLYLFAISFSVLILWGRLCAIIWTSTWLFFVPLRRSGYFPLREAYGPPQNATAKSSETESREHKKRVIMEGLLGRSRSRP